MTADEAIQAAMPKVEKIASTVYRQVRNSGVDWEDLVAAGNLALCETAETWDPKKGTLEQYAYRRVRGAMFQHTAKHTRNIRITEQANNLIFAVREAEDELCQTLQRHPTVAETAEHLRNSGKKEHANIDEKKVTEALQHDTMFIPLGADANENRPSIAHEDLDNISYEDPHTYGIENIEAPQTQDAQNGHQRETVLQLLANFPQPVQQVLQYRFGLDGAQPLTVETIADRLQIDSRKVTQLERWALARLRHPAYT